MILVYIAAGLVLFLLVESLFFLIQSKNLCEEKFGDGWNFDYAAGNVLFEKMRGEKMANEQEVKHRFDGSIRLRPNQRPHEIFDRPKDDETKKNTEHGGKVETCEVSGDGSVGIEGNITIKDKKSAIMFVHSLIDEFEISQEELDW